MLDTSTSTHDVSAAEPSIPGPGNTTTKAELFSRAKDAIAAGDQSLHDAAEALALAREDFKASQREIADAVGKSVAWVNRLLQWRRQGFVGTPFGPGSKARRERQKSVQAPEQRGPSKIDADNAEASTEKFRTEHAEREAEPKTTTVNSPLAGFKFCRRLVVSLRWTTAPSVRRSNTPSPKAKRGHHAQSTNKQVERRRGNAMELLPAGAAAREERSMSTTNTSTSAQAPPKFIRPNFDRMPPELKTLKNWVLWAAVWNGRNGPNALSRFPAMGRARLTLSTGRRSTT